MKLSIVIVNYNVKYYLSQCLDSVSRAIDGVEAEVFVVDNHSHDGSVGYLQSLYPWVNFIENNHNMGFSRANNMAINQSVGEYVLLLNPDTIVGEKVLKDAIAFMDSHPDGGALGVRMLNPDGSKAMESRRGIPTPMTAFYKMTGLCARYPRSHRFAHYYMSYLPWDKAEKIEIVSGAFCFLRRSALDKVGLLDEDYFMYGEDIDLSFRLIKGGYHNYYLPVSILHYKGESTQKSSFRYVHVFYNAMLIFFRKHFSHLSFFVSMPIKAAVIAKALAALVAQQTRLVARSMGIGSEYKPADTFYSFIGNEQAIAQCRKLARRKGLQAEFCVGNEESNPEGHLAFLGRLASRKSVCVVYDSSAYSYATMLQLFASNPVSGMTLGTYSTASKTLITPKEIFR